MAKYHMNREEREITDKSEIADVLKKGRFTAVSMCRADEPYVVTLNYGFDADSNVLYFHSAPKGLKIDFIRSNPRVCATVVEDRGYLMNECAHAYRSVVFWGKMTIVEEMEEKMRGMEVLLNHLEDNPDVVRERTLKDDQAYTNLGVLRLDIEEISGKHGH